MLLRKNIYLRKILGLDYEFGLRLHFTGFGLEIFWAVIYNYTFRYFTGVGFENTILGLRIWITIIIFYGIWTLKYLDYGFGFRLLFINTWTTNFDYDC